MDVGIVERNPEAPPRVPAPPAGREAPVAALTRDAGSDRAAAARLEEIREYFHDQYSQRDVVARTATKSGQHVDWVPAESQTPDGGPLAAAPPTASVPEADTAAPLNGIEAGPPGTVPLLRKPVETLRPAGTLQDYLAKGPRQKALPPPDALEAPAVAVPAVAAAVHKYAHAAQWVTCYGTEGYINTWKPYVQWSNEFSLGQLWLARGSGAGLQTVEAGVQVLKDLYGDWEPHVFIYYTTCGYTRSGANVGGYNTDVGGFVQASTTVFPGMNVALSVPGGPAYDLRLKVQLFDGNWWIQVGDQWMGYYPASLYNAAGLQSQSDLADWGGEIVDDSATHPEPTKTWMGSGAFPPGGFGWAAYMRNLAYQSDPAGTMTPLQGAPSVTNPASYDIVTDFSGTSTWGSNFYFGGPGGV
ncbi:neprosin family prolyl endopeptidase [Cryptosporangium sp. NPDC051539]|uniref:neprosin family prolyl endopeptidase n=1 Tax=Cryptosporangium sp. NPDC051539 TaxID=3363962 RepID=UPI0037B73317